MAKDIKISLGDLLEMSPIKKTPLTVGVALSGGRDSVALLHYLKRIEASANAEHEQLKIVAINIEHGIRGESSINDSKFVAELCAQWGVPLYAFSVDAPFFAKQKGYTLEQAGRALRYGVFDKLLDEGACDTIALAHHLDDQIETVLMRILRGTGIRGLCGMRKTYGRYIRPFLDYDREDVDAYISDNSLKYVDDETNLDTAYMRNFLRSEIVLFKQRYPDMGKSVQRLVDSAVENEEYFEAVLPKIHFYNDEVAIKTCDCENKAIAKRLVFKACNALGVSQDIEEKHYDIVLGLLDAENGKRVDLTHGLSVHKDGESLFFCLRKTEKKFEEIPFAPGEFEDVGISIIEVDKSDIAFGKGDGVLFADLDKISKEAVIRRRCEGDYIRKFGGGTKSLGDFLTDKKIPLRNRDGLVVIADKSRVLAVFGVEISSDVKIDENTKKAVKLKLLK